MLKPSSLGDIIHTLPAVAAIRRAFPDLTIDWLANTEWAPVIEGASFLDRVIPFPRSEFRGLGGLVRGRRWAREHLAVSPYDVAIDFQGLLRSSVLARLSGAGTRVGFANAREWAHCLYHQSICIQSWQSLHAVDRNRTLVGQLLGIETTPVEFPLPEGDPVDIPAGAATGAVLLHPFSRGRGKSLSPGEVAEWCDQLAPHPVWLVGRSGEAERDWPGNVTSFLNRTTLPQLITLVRRAAFSVSVDSGPMHLAAAITDRVLSIHTWSDPRMVGPWQPGSFVWRDSQILPVRELREGMYPERRDLRDAFESRDRLLEKKDLEAIASFVREQLTA